MTAEAAAYLMRRHLVVVHPSQPKVLLERGPDGAPRLPVQDEPLGDSRSALGLAGLLGPELPLVSLGQIAFFRRAAEEGADGVVTELLTTCELFPAPPVDVLRRHEWSGAGEGATVLGLPTPLAEALAGYLGWLAAESGATEAEPAPAEGAARRGHAPGAPAPAEPPPHSLPGSTAALAAAMRAEVAEGDGTREGACSTLEPLVPGDGSAAPLRQLQSWVLSSVWLGDAAAVKVTNPLWPNEPAVTAAIHSLRPDLVPAVVAHGRYAVARGASEPARGGSAEPALGGSHVPDRDHRVAAWMVTRRFEEDHVRTATTSDVLNALAELQAAASGRHAELLAAGVLKRGPHEVAADLGMLWSSPQLAHLTDAERAALPVLERRLGERLARLASAAPLLLTHGDLHQGNAAFTRAGGELPVLFDWTDAALAWPGVDLVTLAGIDEEPNAAELLALRDAYLVAVRAAFHDHPGLLTGVEATLDEGLALAPVYHAVAYAHIAAAVPPAQRAFVDAGRVVSWVVRSMLARWRADA
ncbi:MAG: aminoglycoside phosphotransferase family protein [Trueperaceae bacterium]|nr:aminoglycoside phosphotransferase family protein [Trueperaceae bacterium]